MDKTYVFLVMVHDQLFHIASTVEKALVYMHDYVPAGYIKMTEVDSHE